jgi:hypothetical protein
MYNDFKYVLSLELNLEDIPCGRVVVVDEADNGVVDGRMPSRVTVSKRVEGPVVEIRHKFRNETFCSLSQAEKVMLN